MLRVFAVAGLSLTLLVACSPGADTTASADPNAGLDSEILAWRTDLEASHPTCAAKVEGKGCQDFQVMCKGLQEISADETAKGVGSKVVAAMTFASRNPDGSTGKSGSAFAVFTKTGGTWARVESPPVNMRACAPL